MRLATSILGAVSLFALVACGGESSAPSTPSTPSVPAAAPSTPATPAAAPAEPEPSLQFASLPEPFKSADYTKGQRVFRQCSSCHFTAEGAGAMVGPNLYGMFGRVVGTAEGFAFSPAMQEADFEWTPELLMDYLERPVAFLPGNRMSFSGLRRETDRVAVTAYLMAETGWTAPAETAEEAPDAE